MLAPVLADSPLLSFCECGICFPALFLLTIAAASRARRISCISEEQFQLESGVSETAETGSNKEDPRKGNEKGKDKSGASEDFSPPSYSRCGDCNCR